MSSKVLVTGGTGTLGRSVVRLLQSSGHTPRVLSRTTHDQVGGIEFVTGDLGTGDGIDAAVAGAEVVLHLAGTAKGDEQMTARLVRAASAAGTVSHLVFISVVGADRVPVRSAMDRAMFGYFAAKLGAERVVAGSGVPWTVLRASQFHESMVKVAHGLARWPVVFTPRGFSFQPVSVDEVAARLVDLASGPAAGLVPDLAGPTAYEMGDLVHRYLLAVGRSRPILRVPMAGQAARAIRAGANVAPDRAVGLLGWEDYLARRDPDVSRRSSHR